MLHSSTESFSFKSGVGSIRSTFKSRMGSTDSPAPCRVKTMLRIIPFVPLHLLIPLVTLIWNPLGFSKVFLPLILSVVIPAIPILTQVQSPSTLCSSDLTNGKDFSLSSSPCPTENPLSHLIADLIHPDAQQGPRSPRSKLRPRGHNPSTTRWISTLSPLHPVMPGDLYLKDLRQ